MTAIKPQALEAFLRRPDPGIIAVLIYGEDGEAVRELAERTVGKMAGSSVDPFNVASLSEADLAADPARLADEAQSISMFGGSRVIWVRGAGDAFLKSVTPLLQQEAAGNLIVAEAGILAKSSRLRALFETSTNSLILPLHQAQSGDIAGLVEQSLADNGLRIGADALARFIELCGSSRSLARREAEKLALYAMGSERVSLADVEAICGNDTGASPEALADSVFSGEVEVADRLLHDLLQSGEDAGRLLSAIHQQSLRLSEFRLAIDRGASSDQVVKQSRPVIFFRRQPIIQAQLRAWGLSDLVAAGSTLLSGILAIRQTSRLSQAIANRCVLSLARKAAALRRDR